MKDIFDISSLDDIPKGLCDELKVTKRDDLEKQLISLFETAGRELTLDEVLVGFYRMYGVEMERTKLNSKLYNMTRVPLPALEKVPRKKGVYRMVGEVGGQQSPDLAKRLPASAFFGGRRPSEESPAARILMQEIREGEDE